MTHIHHVFLDTDIASDVDDAMALSVLLGSPDVDLVGVSTVYGDTLLRAKVAARYGRLGGRQLQVSPGIGTPRSQRSVWWAGVEGTLHADLDTEQVDSAHGVDRLIDAAKQYPCELDILAIGPLTNIAAALDADPDFVRDVRHLYIMGGAFFGEPGPDGTGIEHNFRSDATAAARVFASSIPITITSLDFTETVHFEPADLENIENAGALGKSLGADIRQWWDYWSRKWNAPHDPLTVLTALCPDLFQLSASGTVEIAVDQIEEGRSTFTTNPTGFVQLVRAADIAALRAEVVARIIRAGGQGPIPTVPND
jgi:purine nucleosidase